MSTFPTSIKTAVITGSTGVLGSALARQLLAEGAKVVALVRPGCSRLDNLPEADNLIAIECGLNHLAEAPLLVRGQGIASCDVWFHLGWASTFGADARNDTTAQVANIQDSLAAVAAADELGCEVFVGAGSQAEFGRHDCPMGPDTPPFPENGYGIAKLAAGGMTRVECAKRGIRHVWMRVFSVYGPRDNPNTLISSTIRMLLDGRQPLVTACEQLWDYLYCDDAARAFVMAAKCGVDGAVYSLGSGTLRSLREYLEIIRDCIGSNVEIGFGKVAYSAQQVMFLQADINALAKDTGFQPKIDFQDGIARTIRWWQSGCSK